MQRQLGSIMLVAGTCIGSGMIALPIAFAEIGIIPCLLLMICVWFLIYFTSLISVELNLQAGRGETLGTLGRRFSGKFAEMIGTSSFKLLSYSLLSVYIYAGTSVIQKMISYYFEFNFNFTILAIIYSVLSMLILILPIKILDYINRFLFIGLIAVIGALILTLLAAIDFSNLPLFVSGKSYVISLRQILPILFTAFGFQVIFHLLTDYCQKDADMLKRAFFWGSLIPAVIYMAWTTSILGVIYNNSPLFYQKMIESPVEVGELIEELSIIANWSLVRSLIWWITILTIVTSLVGVGKGLKDSVHDIVLRILKSKFAKIENVADLNQNPTLMKSYFGTRVTDLISKDIFSSFITILPSFIVAVLIPNAFINVLGFAGMILVVIAIIMPIYLLSKISKRPLKYKILESKFWLIVSLLSGFLIVICELLNIISW